MAISSNKKFIGMTKFEMHSLQEGDMVEAYIDDKTYLMNTGKVYKDVKVVKVYENHTLCMVPYRTADLHGAYLESFHYGDLRFPQIKTDFENEEEFIDEIISSYISDDKFDNII